VPRAYNRRADPEPDYGQRVLGPNPAQTLRIMGLVRAGHSYEYIVRLGHHQQSWGPNDVQRVLRANRIKVPEPTDPTALTTVRTANITKRQGEAVHLLCQAMTDEEIGQAMAIGPDTARSYINKAIKATRCNSRLDLVVQILTGKLVPTISTGLDDE
jgi:DNA-binding NarL/FixJ family response regulator